MTAVHDGAARARWGARAWPVAFACFMAGAVLIALARAPGPRRLSSGAASGITHQ